MGSSWGLPRTPSSQVLGGLRQGTPAQADRAAPAGSQHPHSTSFMLTVQEKYHGSHIWNFTFSGFVLKRNRGNEHILINPIYSKYGSNM